MLGLVPFAGASISSDAGSVDTLVITTGVQGTTALNSVTVIIHVDANVTGVFGTGAIGTVTITAGANVYPAGVLGTSELGKALVWGIIPTGDDPNWQQIPTQV